jgi:hypothetical protein
VLAVFGLLACLGAAAWAGELTLSWRPNPDSEKVAGYVVRYGGVSGFHPMAFDVGKATSATLSGLEEGVDYYFVVSAYNAAGESTPSEELLHRLPVTNHPPFIEGLKPASTLHDLPSDPIPFRIGDDQTPADRIVVAVAAADPSLVPNENLRLARKGGSFTLTLVPAPGQVGDTIVTVSAQDEAGLVTRQAFPFTVYPFGLFGIAPIGDVQTAEATPVLVPVTLLSLEALPSVSLSAASADWSLVSDSGLRFTGRGTNWTLEITPMPGQFGPVPIEVIAGDGSRQVSRTFLLTVLPVDHPPVLGGLTPVRTEPGEAFAVQFTVDDPDTPQELLRVQARSLNPELIPTGQLVISGAGRKRFLRVVPSGLFHGQASVEIRAADATSVSVTNLQVIVEPASVTNAAPTVQGPPNQVTAPGQPVGPLAFTVADLETPAQQLALRASSSDSELIPAAGLVLGGDGSARTIVVIPTTGRAGIATVFLTAQDATGGLGAAQFDVVVTLSNRPPSIAVPPEVSVDENGVAWPVSVEVSDFEDAPEQLRLTASSDNPELLAPSGIRIDGTGRQRTLALRPVPGRSGAARLSLQVRDRDNATGSASFVLSVRAAARSDFNGDARGDIVFQHRSGNVALWYLDRLELRMASVFWPNAPSDPAATLVATPDLDNDGFPELLFQDPAGVLSDWTMDGSLRVAVNAFTPPGTGGPEWRVAASGDFDGDGRQDLLFQHTDGLLAVWLMDGFSQLGAAVLEPPNPGAVWRVAGCGNFSGTNRTDLVFQHPDGTLAVWFMQGLQRVGAALVEPANPGPSTRLVAVDDYDRDGKVDLLMQRGDGTLAFWILDGIRRTAELAITNAPAISRDWNVARTR